MLSEVQGLRTQLSERAAAGPLSADDLLAKATEVGDVKLVVAETPGANPNLMRQLIDQIRKKAAPCAILLAAKQGEDKVTLVAGLSRELVDKGLSAGDWVRDTAKIVGGGGGGKPDMAQAGGKDPAKIPEALEVALENISGKL